MSKTFLFDCFTQHNHLAEKIKIHNSVISFVCQHCFLNLISCVTMFLHPQYAACTQCNHKCVDLCWESLNCTCAKLSFKLITVEEEQTHLFTKILHLRKVLNQSQNHVKQKILCLAEELTDDVDNDEMKIKASTDMQQLVDLMFSFFWNSIVLSFSQTVKAYLCSSWGFLWVPKLILRYHILFTWQDSELSH